MKDIFNGKKVVKWFLRLLPILIFLFTFIALISYAHNESYGYEYWNIIDWFYINNGAYDLIIDLLDFPMFRNINNWVLTTFDANIYVELAMRILEYELILSIVFIIFDVLNYMLTIANRFFEKGRDLNE